MANFLQHPQEDFLEDIDLRAWPEGERRYLIETMPPEVDEHIFDNDEGEEVGQIDYLDAFAMPTNEIIDLHSNNGLLTTRPLTQLFLNADVSAFPPFQVLLRQNLEFFEVNHEDLVVINKMGRKDTVVLGQVGLRCRACSRLPPDQRPPSACLFPTKLDEVFQAAQQMTGNHIIPCCPCLPNDVRNELLNHLSQCAELLRPGDEALWVQRCHDLGVLEDQNRLRFSLRINDMTPVDMSYTPADMSYTDFEW